MGKGRQQWNKGATKTNQSDVSADTTGVVSISRDGCRNPDGEVEVHPIHGGSVIMTEASASLASRDAGEKHSFSITDIEQGELYSCFWLSTIGAVVRKNPAFVQSLFTPTKDSEGRDAYSITLHARNGKFSATPYCYVVNQNLPSRRNGESYYAWAGEELWVALLEKALGAAFGGYQGIHIGSAVEAFGFLTGTLGTEHAIDQMADPIRA